MTPSRHPDWKELAKRLVELHKGQTASAVPIWEGVAGVVVAIVKPNKNWRVYDGRGLKPKDVRTFLWETRKDRTLQRGSACVWARYDEEEDRSYVGVGACVAPAVAKRAEHYPTLAPILELA